MGFVVGPQEIKVRIRQYRGSVLLTFGIREFFWLFWIVFILLVPRLFRPDFGLIIGISFALIGSQIVVFFWSLIPKWVATLRPSGIEFRSRLAASFGIGRWKKAAWGQVASLRSAKTYEAKGVVTTLGVEMDIQDPESPSGLYCLRVSSAEMGFLDYLEAMVRWVDPSKVDPDLRRVLEKENKLAYAESRKTGATWGAVMGLILAGAIFSTRALPREERWPVYLGIWILALLAGFAYRRIRRS